MTKKIIILFFLGYSLTSYSQDFKVVIDIDSLSQNTRIKLYTVNNYERISSLEVNNFISSAIKKDKKKPWILTGKLNDSTSLYRLHIGDFSDEKVHFYNNTVTFLSLKKGDSIYLKFPNTFKFSNYTVSNSSINSDLQKVFQVNHSIRDLEKILDDGTELQKKKALIALTSLRHSKKQMIDTISNSDVFYVLVNPELQKHSKNLLFFENEPKYSNKLFDEFQLSIFSKQIKRDLSVIKRSSPLNKSKYLYIFIIAFLGLILLYVFYISKLKKNHLLLLSPNERKILHMIAEGKSNKEIATEKFREISTIKKQINSIYKKLKVKNRIEAINYFEKYKK